MIALSVFIVFYVAFGTFLSLNQEKIVYQPFPQDFNSCSSFSDAEKITHQGTRMYVHNTSKPVVVLYHGNAGSACDRDFYADMFNQAGYGYVIVEYAGYSNDDRETSHNLVKQDAKNVVAFLEKREIEDVTIVGESIGTGVAGYHTSIAQPEKLLLISPFTNLADIANSRFWFYPASILVDNAFDNAFNLNDYSGQVTIIHGTEDNIIPHRFGKKLFEALYTEKNFISIPNAGHNDLFLYEETYATVQNFLKDN
jgi:pimeloyl-ACP methyl ester carboxylesterase